MLLQNMAFHGTTIGKKLNMDEVQNGQDTKLNLRPFMLSAVGDNKSD